MIVSNVITSDDVIKNNKHRIHDRLIDFSGILGDYEESTGETHVVIRDTSYTSSFVCHVPTFTTDTEIELYCDTIVFYTEKNQQEAARHPKVYTYEPSDNSVRVPLNGRMVFKDNETANRYYNIFLKCPNVSERDDRIEILFVRPPPVLPAEKK